MITLEKKRALSNYFENLADAIDLTEAQYKTAIEKYTTVGNFLSVPGTLLAPYDPEIVSQGSFRIGTVIRPITEDGEFDVDLTCRLHDRFPKKQIDIKKLVEQRLRQDADYSRMLDDEHRRCWRLQYADSARFHLDIVPALPDNYNWITIQGVPENLAKHAITITDKKHPLYEKFAHSTDWPKSNPEGFAAWFLEIMKDQADAIRIRLKTELLLESVEKVPNYKVRTPLQRGIQLMKRHRDLMFDGQDEKPVSIIITTLAAKSYEKVIKESPSLLFYEIVNRMIEVMPSFIEVRQGDWWIENPVNPLENFADKWNEDKRKAETFSRWYKQLQLDFKQVLEERNMQDAIDSLRPKFGTRAINEATKKTFAPSTIKVYESSHPISFRVPHRQRPLWPLSLGYVVRVNAKYKKKGGWEFVDLTNSPIPKGCSIRFTATTLVPKPFDVFWQVVNTGKEARDAGQLRGQILPAKTWGAGGLFLDEHSGYTGSHWVECFVVKEGICVARSGEIIVNVQ